MKMPSRPILALAVFLGGLPAAAQNLTPEDILAQVDARVAALNPYQALLNDPDPERSLAAMQIMLESGDPTLVRLATEFGLLSPNPQVQRIALEGVLATEPVLTLRLDGTQAEGDFQHVIIEWLRGTINADGIGFAQVPVGKYSDEARCYLWWGENSCTITVNSEGVFLEFPNNNFRGALTISPEGQLVGTATMSNMTNPVPLTISLLD